MALDLYVRGVSLQPGRNRRSFERSLIFLHSHGVGTAPAIQIFKTYGVDAIQAHDREFVSARLEHPRDRLQDSRRDRD